MKNVYDRIGRKKKKLFISVFLIKESFRYKNESEYIRYP